MKNLLISLLAILFISTAVLSQPDKRVLSLENKTKDKALVTKLPPNVYRVKVNYDLPVEKVVKLGKYDWTDGDITSKHFPLKRSGTADVEIEIKHFNRKISSGEVIAELDTMGFRPAELHELGALGEQYPDSQREFPIIALGSVWHSLYSDYRYVPVIARRRGRGRGLGLSLFGDVWGASCGFSAVPK